VLTFIGLSVLLILTPGPNQALLTSRVLSGGRCAGFAAVRGLAGQGVKHFSFYNFGMLRPHNLDWVRTAIAGLGKEAA